MHLLLLVVGVLAAFAQAYVPLVVASHKLVPGLRDTIDSSSDVDVFDATNALKKLVSECSSDAYVIAEIPGLKFTDVNEYRLDAWPFVVTYLRLASSNLGAAFVTEPIDLNFLEKYIIKTCEAETVNLEYNDEGDVAVYYDTRKRIIRVTFAPLVEDNNERYNQLRRYDEYIRKVIRVLPSPHYSIIMTSTTNEFVHPVPEAVRESSPRKFQVFDSVINDESRQNEFERNDDRFQRTEPDWIENKNTMNRYLKNRHRDEVHFWRNPELWQKNQSLVLTVALVVMTLGLKRFASAVFRPSSPIIGRPKTD